MSEQQLIHHMETWLYYQAQKKWNKSPSEVSEIFEKNKVFDYIVNCYDYLHLSSYEMALNDIEILLKNRGIVL